MKNNLFRYGAALLISTCLLGGHGIAYGQRREEQTSFDIRTTAVTVEENYNFVITMRAWNSINCMLMT